MENLLKPIKGNCGAPLTDEEFFGREKELLRLEKLLLQGKTNILIPGPRRWGKTNFVKKFMKINKRKADFVYIVLQSCHTLLSFREKITEKLYDQKNKKYIWDLTKVKTRKMITKTSETVREIAKFIKIDPLKTSPQEILQGMDPLFKKVAEHNVILVLDEFADFLLNLEQEESLKSVEAVLTYMRELRDEQGVRMVITSSINITNTVKRMGLEHLITNLKSFPLPPLDRQEVLLLFKGLLLYKGIEAEEEADGFILQKLGSGIHFHIQLLADAIPNPVSAKGKKIGAADLEKFYGLAVQRDDPGLSLLHSRIEKKDHFAKKDKKTALKLLAHLSHQDMALDDLFPLLQSWESDKTRIRFIAERLTDEGYLGKTGKSWHFLSIFLKDWWKEHYSHEI